MKYMFKKSVAAIAMVAVSSTGYAAGELNLFNWGNYTSPELITKFEKQYDVKVTVTDYDSNSTALAKVKAGGHGYDLVVPSANYMQIWVSEGLLLESRPDKMSNFKHILPEFANPEWDEGRRYSVPWQWGSVGMIVDTSVYNGNINTASIYLDPPDELKGKINVTPEMNDVINSTIMYLGGDPCTTDKTLLKKVRDKLIAAKPHWLSMDYGVIEKFAGRDLAASLYWNGASFRARKKNPDVRFGYPQEGFALWMDSVAVLKDAKNVENAKLFQNFIMMPENAALISSFARYANGIKGSSEFMPADMKDAPEIIIDPKLAGAGKFLPACSPEATKIYTAIWTELQK
ncbi:MAG: spermidine/putrescine transport system substrate-binding protein [Gammaproteobacteria bacterium]|jgi:spermidine/putrescine transport system substrate-binding protein